MDKSKQQYVYDTHVHTSQASKCAVSSGREIAVSYHAAGYDGIIITDHFLNGYTRVPADLEWSERIELFCSGYEEAHLRGREIGLVVMLGWEYNFDGSEFLTYGLDKNWLLAHPEMLAWSPEEYFAAVHKAGGFISQAHPFRLRTDIPPVKLFPELIDAIEVYNGGNPEHVYNQKALAYAQLHGLLMTAGSDTHSANGIKPGAMVFPNRIQSIKEFITAIRNETYKVLDKRIPKKID